MSISIVAFIVILTSFRSIDGACLPAPPGFTFFPLMNIKASPSMLAYFGTKFSVDLPVTPPPSTLTLAAQQCEANKLCVGFNSEFKIKSNPESFAVDPSYTGCQGFYYRTRCPTFAGYQFTAKSNAPGNNLAITTPPASTWSSNNNRIAFGLGNTSAACDMDPKCLGFNTNGYLKSSLVGLAVDPSWAKYSCHGFYTKLKSPPPPPLPAVTCSGPVTIPGYTFIQGYTVKEVSPNKIFIGLKSTLKSATILCSEYIGCWGFNSDGQRTLSPQSLARDPGLTAPCQGFYVKSTCPEFPGYQFMPGYNVNGLNLQVMGVWAKKAVDNRIVTGVVDAITACDYHMGISACKGVNTNGYLKHSLSGLFNGSMSQLDPNAFSSNLVCSGFYLRVGSPAGQKYTGKQIEVGPDYGILCDSGTMEKQLYDSLIKDCGQGDTTSVKRGAPRTCNGDSYSISLKSFTLGGQISDSDCTLTPHCDEYDARCNLPPAPTPHTCATCFDNTCTLDVKEGHFTNQAEMQALINMTVLILRGGLFDNARDFQSHNPPYASCANTYPPRRGLPLSLCQYDELSPPAFDIWGRPTWKKFPTQVRVNKYQFQFPSSKVYPDQNNAQINPDGLSVKLTCPNFKKTADSIFGGRTCPPEMDSALIFAAVAVGFLASPAVPAAILGLVQASCSILDATA